MTRRQLFTLAIPALVTGPAYAGLVEPRWLETTEYRLRIGRHALAKSVRVLHISDFHASRFVPVSFIEEAIARGLALKPDVICVTGDFITTFGGFDNQLYVKALKRLSAAAPCFATMGNHDGGVWTVSKEGLPDHNVVDDLLRDSGIELLHNRSVRVRVRGEEIAFVGVGDLWSQEIFADKAFSQVEKTDRVVLLSHNPDSKELLEPHPWHLMLSGHTHGGQVIFPLAGPSFAPVRDKRYVAGLKPWGDRWIHVTRGVGNVAGVRFQCRPEVNLLTLT